MAPSEPIVPHRHLLELLDDTVREGCWHTPYSCQCLCGKWVKTTVPALKSHLFGSMCTMQYERFPLHGATALLDRIKAKNRDMSVTDFLPPDPEDWVTTPGHHCSGCDATLIDEKSKSSHQDKCRFLAECPGMLRAVVAVKLPCSNFYPLRDAPPSDTSLSIASSFRPYGECLPRAAVVDRSTIEARVEEMSKDDPDAIAKVFRMMVLDANYKEVLALMILRKDQAVKTPTAELQKLFDCARCFCEEFPQLVHLVGGDARTMLQVFKWDGHGEDDGGLQAFTERDKYEPVFSYYKDLLAYVYLNHAESLRPYLEWMRGRTTKEAHQRGVLASLLYDLILEETPTGTPPAVVKHALLYLCRARSIHDVTIVEAGRGAKLLSLVLHAQRCGLLCKYVLRTSAEGATPKDGMPLIVAGNNSTTMHLLSPYVAILRTLDSQKPSHRRVTVDVLWNITVDGFTVYEKEWSAFIPRMESEFQQLCQRGFQGDDWERVADVSNRLHIRDWANMDAHVVLKSGGTLDLQCLRTSHDAWRLVDRLNALSMLAFLVLGCGAGRFTEVANLSLYQVVWRNGNLYFMLVSRKVGALGARKGKPRLLMLPRNIARFIVLARAAFKLIGCKAIPRKLFPDLPDRDGATSEAFMRLTRMPPDAKKFTLIMIRHWACAVLNLMYPDGVENVGRIVSNGEVSELSGHTGRTAFLRYACVAEHRRAGLCTNYHTRLGYTPPTEATEDNPGQPSVGAGTAPPGGDGRGQRALEAMFGQGARFRSPEQEAAFDAVLRSQDVLHLGITLFPGVGKTAVVMAPTVDSFLAGEDPRTVFFLVPHAPLVGYHVTSMTRVLRRVCSWDGEEDNDHFWVVGYTGKDIGRQPPAELSSLDDLPHVVVLTIDALAALTTHHPQVLADIVRAGALSSVVIDEIQTLFEEVMFRPQPYESLRVVSTWGVRVILLSGSLLPPMVSDAASWLRLRDGATEDDTPFPVVGGGDPIMAQFGLEVAEVLNDDFVEGCAKMIANRAKETSIHVVCSRKHNAHLLKEAIRSVFLGRDGAPAPPVMSVVTGDSETAVKIRSGREWALGKYRIWITTCCALEGNENPLCNQVYMMGLPNSVSSLLQILGRLREEQGGPDSCATLLLPKGSKNLDHHLSLCKKADRDRIDHLFSRQRALGGTPEETAEALLTKGGLVRYLQRPGCLFDNLRDLYQHTPAGKGCGRCTNCDHQNKTRASQCPSHNYGAGWCVPANTTVTPTPSPAGATGASARTASENPPLREVVVDQSTPGLLSPLPSQPSGGTPQGSLCGSKRPHHRGNGGVSIGFTSGLRPGASTPASPSKMSSHCSASPAASSTTRGGSEEDPFSTSSAAASPFRKRLCAPTEATPSSSDHSVAAYPGGFSVSAGGSVVSGAASHSSVRSTASAVHLAQVRAKATWSQDKMMEKRADSQIRRLIHNCPWCLGSDCIGYCATKGLCSLCGAQYGRHDACACPMTLKWRCRSCPTFVTHKRGEWERHKEDYGCSLGYDLVDNLGKAMQETLKQCKTCYLCLDWQCVPGQCRGGPSKKRNRILAILFRTAADSQIGLLHLVQGVYSSPSMRNKFFGSLPKRALPSDASAVHPYQAPLKESLRWSFDEQRFAP